MGISNTGGVTLVPRCGPMAGEREEGITHGAGSESGIGVGGDKAVDGGGDGAAAVILSCTTGSGVEDTGRELGASASESTKQEDGVGDCTTLSGAVSVEDVGRELGICCTVSMDTEIIDSPL
jgi:hypothetical protein